MTNGLNAYKLMQEYSFKMSQSIPSSRAQHAYSIFNASLFNTIAFRFWQADKNNAADNDYEDVLQLFQQKS